MTLKGKTVIISGGCSGMGFATAQQVVESGGLVIITDINAEKMSEAEKKLGSGIIKTHCLDVTKEEQISAFFDGIDKFDHLVLCASTYAMGAFVESDTGPVRSYFETKFWGQYYFAKHGAKKIDPTGSITFFGGSANRRATPNLTPSAAINGAIEGLAKTLTVELAPIRVNVMCPGLVDTESYDYMPADQKKAFYDGVAQSLPLGRIGKPEDIAKGVLFLIESDYSTGSVVVIDGGYVVN